MTQKQRITIAYSCIKCDTGFGDLKQILMRSILGLQCQN